MASMPEKRILVAGVGALGCEVLKNLVCSGFDSIDIIDGDTIQVTNLNRQWFFTDSHIGQAKVVVAAELMGKSINPHRCWVQDKPESFYLQFDLIMCCLDSIESRRWLNSMVVSLSETNPRQRSITLIDGGIEGFKGHTRMVYPKRTACLECTMGLTSRPQNYPICAIANHPRTIEQCVEWARKIYWKTNHPHTFLDAENPEHTRLLYSQINQRAVQFGIDPLEETRVVPMLNSIVPATMPIVSIVAGFCVLQVMSLFLGVLEKSYTLINIQDSFYHLSLAIDRNTDCTVCGDHFHRYQCKRTTTLSEFISDLSESNHFDLACPSLRTGNQSLYFSHPPALFRATQANLSKRLSDLVDSGTIITFIDKTIPDPLRILIGFI